MSTDTLKKEMLQNTFLREPRLHKSLDTFGNVFRHATEPVTETQMLVNKTFVKHGNINPKKMFKSVLLGLICPIGFL